MFLGMNGVGNDGSVFCWKVSYRGYRGGFLILWNKMGESFD